jgi:hypothetical protein
MKKSEMKTSVKAIARDTILHAKEAQKAVADNGLAEGRMDNVIGEIYTIHDGDWAGWCNLRWLGGDGKWHLAMYHHDELEFVSEAYDSNYSDAVVRWLAGETV